MWIIEKFQKGNINLRTTTVLKSPILSMIFNTYTENNWRLFQLLLLEVAK